MVCPIFRKKTLSLFLFRAQPFSKFASYKAENNKQTSPIEIIILSSSWCNHFGFWNSSFVEFRCDYQMFLVGTELNHRNQKNWQHSRRHWLDCRKSVARITIYIGRNHWQNQNTHTHTVCVLFFLSLWDFNVSCFYLSRSIIIAEANTRRIANRICRIWAQRKQTKNKKKSPSTKITYSGVCS